MKADRGKGAISGGYIALVSKGFLVAIGVDASLLMMMMVAVRVLKNAASDVPSVTKMQVIERSARGK